MPSRPRPKKSPRKRSAPSRRRRNSWWARLDDEELLDLRFCDLGLVIESSALAPHIERLHAELERRGLRFRPHFWFSEEWFSPDGIPGVAIPFYLGHPRLGRLERRFMHEVEGGEARWLRRILRHETGHAIDTAYRLRRRKAWRQQFGKASSRYPTVYSPRPASRRHVLHLGHWYAQSHPCEDFAETFAVWLRPNATWRHDYDGWPALKKLEYVDQVMTEIGDEVPAVRNREHVEPLRDNKKTLRQHYQAKVRYYDNSTSDRYDAMLLRVFKPKARNPRRPKAAAFLRQNQPQIVRLLERRTRLHPYLVEHIIKIATQRARELDLRVAPPIRAAKRKAFLMLARILHDLIRCGRERYAL